MKIKNFSKNEVILISVIFLILVFVSLLTKYEGATDVGDYADTAKYFAGQYNADIRSSHSFLYGFFHSPFIIFDSFILFKISSIVFLVLIILSVYKISGYEKKAFWLMFLSPVVWFMGPWINPIQIASLFFLWAYFFIQKFRREEEIKYLVLSGIFLGLSWAFWDAVLFFSLIFVASFLYDRKLYHFFIILISIILGLIPRLILDQIILGFPFMSILRYFFGIVTSVLFSGVYGNMASFNYKSLIIIILFLPVFIYKLFSKKENFDVNFIIFLSLSAILIIKNSQLRYLLILMPIIILELSKVINQIQFKKQLIMSSILLILLISPYTLQISSQKNIGDIENVFSHLGSLDFSNSNSIFLNKDLHSIERDFPNQTFIVGNLPDDYQLLAHLYWGKSITEFVSIQDYKFYLNNQTIIFEKTFSPVPKIRERRQIWLAGGISKSENDPTNFSSIDFAIGVGEPVNITGFSVTKQYNNLFVSKKN